MSFRDGESFESNNDLFKKINELYRRALNERLNIIDENELNESFIINSRSGHGFKNRIRMTNVQGWIDSYYVDNESNEGHIMIALTNDGNKDFLITKGKAIAQGIFTKYLVTDDDEPNISKRLGGIGSTETN